MRNLIHDHQIEEEDEEMDDISEGESDFTFDEPEATAVIASLTPGKVGVKAFFPPLSSPVSLTDTNVSFLDRASHHQPHLRSR
jgi:hypothetical protein